MRSRLSLAACLVAVVIVSAAAGQVWADEERRARIVLMWVDRSGTLSFTDDPKRVPSAYREHIGRKPTDWPRVTVDQVSNDKRRETLRARLKALRAAPSAGCGCPK